MDWQAKAGYKLFLTEKQRLSSASYPVPAPNADGICFHVATSSSCLGLLAKFQHLLDV